MKTPLITLKERFGNHVLSLSTAMESGDEKAFTEELNAMVRERDDGLWSQLRKLTADLSGALDRFQLDSRLVDLAEKEVPDAKQRLDYVLKMTDEAAHKTMDLVDQSAPMAGKTAKTAGELKLSWMQFRAREISAEDFRNMLTKMDAFLPAAQRDSEDVRKNLNEVLMTQGYQDLSGQIIRGVIKLVGEVEQTLGELVHLATGHTQADRSHDEFSTSRGYGPAVPGVDHGVTVDGQQDVDALLSGLGM